MSSNSDDDLRYEKCVVCKKSQTGDNCPIEYYDNNTQDWHRSSSEKTDIVLKSINNSNNINIPDEFFDEIKAQMTSFVDFGYTIRCFGVTKCSTGNYMMIMEYKKDGGLHEYLDKNFYLLTWEQKLDILYTAIKGLSKIHKAKLIHKDFHAGNIIIENNVSYIADFGLCKRVNSDDKKHRPNTNEDITPQIITDLIKSCWDDNPDVRPKAINLVDMLSKYRRKDHEIWAQIKVIEDKMDFNIPPEKAGLNYKKPLEQTFYTSKLISELSK
ncbi:38149_t:CDS:2 [Gigaspora margarita]|uniref:38149_t:CDS:1 n=1 Tax=Gigaspora margarita TaxID=4874 RepID=A0ABM8VXB2_GIGMA|nr:38149_t:CDS:2 [Gigaspora margarita]